MSKLIKELPKELRLTIVGTAIIIFIFRAMPGPGPGLVWFEIDELGFNEQFFSVLSLLASILTLVGIILLICASFINYKIYSKHSKTILVLCWLVILLGYLTSQNLVTARGIIISGKNLVTTSDLAKFGLIILHV